MDWTYEDLAKQQGYQHIAGVDEAGRGPLAGPVVAAACILPFNIPGINDSKKLSTKKRAELFELLTTHPDIAFGIGLCSPDEIDHYNILQASMLAMLRAIENLSCADYVLIDGNRVPKTTLPAQAIVKGDSKSPSIAAASIIAKETRDQIMLDYHDQYPQYNFAKHKGYPTKEHIEALSMHGISAIHRKTFAPVAKCLTIPNIIGKL